MRTGLQRTVAVLLMALLAGTGLAGVTAWTPASVGLVGPAAAQDDDDGAGNDDDGGDDDDGVRAGDDRDDGDDGQAPAGGIETGHGTAAQDDDGDDDGADDDDGQAPAGGIETGRGGTADLVTTPAGSDRSSGVADVATTVAPIAALALGGVVVGRLVLARRGAAEG